MALFKETENLHEDTHLLAISSLVNQLCKAQDYTYTDDISYILNEQCKVCIVFDGHGDNRVIDFIRAIPNNKMNELVSAANPVESLANYININFKYVNLTSGSTMCLVKIFSNRIECINCGDSQVAVYKNGALEYMNKEHNYKNEKERERLEKKVNYIPSSNIKMVECDKLISIYSEYIEWEMPIKNFKLACTQALGHNGITGYDPESVIIPLVSGDRYKVIIGSDGLWDMIMNDDEEDMKQLYSKNVDEIMFQTTNRWLQEWNMQDLLNNNPDIIQCKFEPKHCDDVAIIVADIIPI